MSVRLLPDAGDAVELNDAAGGIVNVSIEVGAPTAREVAYDRAGQDGNDDHTHYVGARAVTVTVDLRERPHTRQALLDRLAIVMHPRNRLWLEHATVPGQPARRLRVRPADLPVAWDNPASLVIPLAFKTVGRPFWLGEQRLVDLTPDGPGPGLAIPAVMPLTFPAAPSRVAHAYNAGTEDAVWQLTLTGPVRNPSLRREDTGEVVALRLTLLDGQAAVVDSDTRTVTVDGQPRYAAVDQDATSWWQIPPRTSVPVSLPVAAATAPGVGVLAFADTFYA